LLATGSLVFPENRAFAADWGPGRQATGMSGHHGLCLAGLPC
jgi:hypothetical protein